MCTFKVPPGRVLTRLALAHTGLIAAAAGNGKFYCKAHHPHNVGKKARKEADKATRPKRQRNNSNKAKGH